MCDGNEQCEVHIFELQREELMSRLQKLHVQYVCNLRGCERKLSQKIIYNLLELTN